ncbi:hypothetical protein PGT21_050251 [Puccinia graminis f. sp. tritici]|uniref:Uncharacterized protein n=1 Tax=Puccinia graminis f. sp. tritici TaxID=56615 RepID=A0A5B0QAV1_PUCGR|nr:hypothetical protein PGT21_050251 [Puccinia graminis f. sp. tritici]
MLLHFLFYSHCKYLEICNSLNTASSIFDPRPSMTGLRMNNSLQLCSRFFPHQSVFTRYVCSFSECFLYCSLLNMVLLSGLFSLCPAVKEGVSSSFISFFAYGSLLDLFLSRSSCVVIACYFFFTYYFKSFIKMLS